MSGLHSVIGRVVSRLLVIAQFVAFAVLLIPGEAPGGRAAGGCLVLAGLLWLGWTLAHNRLGNFHVRPETRVGARLVTTGPYRLVRHPMYFGALVVGLGLVVFAPSWLKVAVWLALLAVLIGKAKLEEAALRRQFADYDVYRRGRRFLVPWIG